MEDILSGMAFILSFVVCCAILGYVLLVPLLARLMPKSRAVAAVSLVCSLAYLFLCLPPPSTSFSAAMGWPFDQIPVIALIIGMKGLRLSRFRRISFEAFCFLVSVVLVVLVIAKWVWLATC